MAYGNSLGKTSLKVRCELEIRIVHNEPRKFYEAFQDELDIMAYGGTPDKARNELLGTIESFILAQHEYGYLDQMEEVRDGQIDIRITGTEIVLSKKN